MSPDTGLRLVREHGWDVHHVVHELFDELLVELVAARDPASFLVWTIPLCHDLQQHLRFEDEHVLSIAKELLRTPPPNGTVEAFLEDHRLIRERLDRLFDLSVQRLHREIDAALVQETLAVLEDLMAHHDQRETEFLYGPLAEVLDADRRQQVLDQLAATPLVDVRQARRMVNGWIDGDLVARLGRDYGAWVSGGSLADLPDVPLPELGRVEAAHPKLRRRDARLVAEFRAGDFEDEAERRQGWRRAEQTLRTTIRFALDAAFEHAQTLDDRG